MFLASITTGEPADIKTEAVKESTEKQMTSLAEAQSSKDH
jgi:hypothetical protein